jgi:hypothetical protein
MWDDATFVAGVTNTYFPLPQGATWVYEGATDEGLERIEIEVLDPATSPKTVNGVTVTVVEDTVFLDGEVIEYTHDWYAEDSDGNVCSPSTTARWRSALGNGTWTVRSPVS